MTARTVQPDSLAAVPDSELEILASHRLGLLMDSAASIQQTEDVSAMADAVIGSLLAGTEFGRAFLLEPVSGGFEEISIIGGQTRLGSTDGSEGDPISRTLLNAASRGQVVRLMDEPDIQAAVSIVGAGVKEALCVPVKVGEVDRGVSLPRCQRRQRFRQLGCSRLLFGDRSTVRTGIRESPAIGSSDRSGSSGAGARGRSDGSKENVASRNRFLGRNQMAT